MPMRAKAPALTAATLRANTDANLVKATALGAGRDEPASAALVVGQDLVAVELEETEPAKDVGWFRFPSGLVRWVRYSHCVNLLCRLAGPRGVGSPPGPFLYLTPVLSQLGTRKSRVFALK